MQSKAATPAQYLAELPPDRRAALQAVRKVIRANLDRDYEEGMQYGMIGYYVPHSVYPPGYHCDPRQPLPFASIASQKNHMSLYLMCIYGHPGLNAWFQEAWKKTGKKLDMGKSCIRFKKLDDLALDVIGEAIRRAPAKKFITCYESNILTLNKSATKKATTRKTAKTPASQKTRSKKAPARGKSPAKTGAKARKTSVQRRSRSG